jgi:HAE1 family hydrophobic/amphiphilic exporter-1
VVSFSIDDLPVIALAVTGYGDEKIQAQLQASTIPDLEDVKGVSAATIVGGQGQRVTITPTRRSSPPPASPRRAHRRPQAERRALPGGTVTEGDQTLTVQTGSKLTSVDQISALPLVPPRRPSSRGRPRTVR